MGKGLEMSKNFKEFDFSKYLMHLFFGSEEVILILPSFLKRYYNKGGPGGGEDDKREVICSMVRTSFIDDRKCDEIMGPL